MTDDDNHYSELQEVRMELIDRHEALKAKVNRDEYEDNEYGPATARSKKARDEGKRDATLRSISMIEDVLNDWADRDDRDGPSDE